MAASLLLCAALSFLLSLSVAHADGFCAASPSLSTNSDSEALYSKVMDPTLSPSHFQDLPGFTRSVYKRDHALITPESHVFSALPNWINALGAYLITPAMGSHFAMYLVKMQENSESGLPPSDVERFIFVIQGVVTLANATSIRDKLMVDSYTYLPANYAHFIYCKAFATLVVIERRYAYIGSHITEPITGLTPRQPPLETQGEVFELRKLLPTSLPYDFNIHVSLD